MGKTIIVIGIVIVLIGLLYHFFPNALKWFGNLPGDIKVDRPNAKFYFPIVSMILVSILFNVIIKIYRYFQ